MKTFLKIMAFFQWIFAPWVKYHKIENQITIILRNSYTEYEASKDLQKLENLIKIVNVLENTSINGSTKNIRQKIKDEWEAKTSVIV